MSKYEVVVTVVSKDPPRYTLYPVTRTSSVEAVQERLIWNEETTVADRLVGVEGDVVSDDGGGETKPLSRQPKSGALPEIAGGVTPNSE